MPKEGWVLDIDRAIAKGNKIRELSNYSQMGKMERLKKVGVNSILEWNELH